MNDERLKREILIPIAIVLIVLAIGTLIWGIVSPAQLSLGMTIQAFMSRAVVGILIALVMVQLFAKETFGTEVDFNNKFTTGMILGLGIAVATLVNGFISFILVLAIGAVLIFLVNFVFNKFLGRDRNPLSNFDATPREIVEPIFAMGCGLGATLLHGLFFGLVAGFKILVCSALVFGLLYFVKYITKKGEVPVEVSDEVTEETEV